MLRKMLLITASAIAGVYLTSKEGQNARKALQKKKVAIEPAIKELIKQANDVLAGTKEIDSNEIRVNVEKIVDEAKASLINLDLDKVTETVKEAIKVASRQIRDASNELEKTKRIVNKKAKSKSTPKK